MRGFSLGKEKKELETPLELNLGGACVRAFIHFFSSCCTCCSFWKGRVEDLGVTLVLDFLFISRKYDLSLE